MIGRWSARVAVLTLLVAGLALCLCGAPPAASQPKATLVSLDVPAVLVVSGTPRERGVVYGTKHRDGIRHFLNQEIYAAFIQKPSPKEEMLRYAGECAQVIKSECPVIHTELQGIAEGSGLRLEEVVLITLHEELYHRGVLPKVNHCTAVAVGPPDAANNRTYVGQTWDWMESVAGMSSMVEWRREDGPSVLGYGFPGMPVGAGLNSAGLALCWTSANLGDKAQSVRVGLPSYVMLTHLLYQKDLEGVIRAAGQNKHAGWFTFVMADGEGNLLNIEGSPKGVTVERSKGRLVRIGYGSREMTGTPAGQDVKFHPRCQKMYDLLEESAGRTDLARLQHCFTDERCGISVGKATIDMMVFDTTTKTAYLSRGPSYKTAWHEFRFSQSK